MKTQFTCLLLVCLWATVLPQPADVYPRYQKFINQHIHHKMSANSCNAVITKRKITETGSNMCKETNTFIIADLSTVRSVCTGGGEPYGNGLTKSTNPFSIIVCKLKKGDRRPRCQYKGKAYTRKIAIACDRGYPVHYGSDIVYFQN